MTLSTPRLVLASCAVLASVALAIAVQADAPPDQYAIFQAQTPTIKDMHALLEWERFPENNLLTGDAGADGGMWAEKQTFADATDRCQRLGGGWRLPTVKELLTIIDEEPHQVYFDGGTPYIYVDRNAFPTAKPETYWSSSASTINNQVWTVDFGTGQTQPDNGIVPHLNRCVRVAP
jgi:hypothetical protein